MFKRFVSVIENLCIEYTDYDGAYEAVEEARAANIIDDRQYRILTDWVVGNMLHRAAGEVQNA